MWIELWTTDTDRAFAFYEKLVGYECQEFGEVEGEPYQLMRRDGRFRSGMVRMPWSGVEPNWLPYVLVDDPSKTAHRVEGLGGRLILSPDGVRHGGAAVIVDPSGAAFAIQRRPIREAPAKMMTNLWKFALLIVLFTLSSFGCAGSHVSVGVAVPGPWYGYPGPYGGPPVWVGRPYPGYW